MVCLLVAADLPAETELFGFAAETVLFGLPAAATLFRPAAAVFRPAETVFLPAAAVFLPPGAVLFRAGPVVDLPVADRLRSARKVLTSVLTRSPLRRAEMPVTPCFLS